MVTLRQRLAAIVGVAMVFSTMLFAGGTALAQTYPPGTSTVPPSCTPGNANAGTVVVNQTFRVPLCGPFAPGAAVTTTVNGQSVGPKAAKPDGTATVVITVKSQTALAIDDPVEVEAQCGVNRVVGTGPGASGGSVTATGQFTLSCTSTTTTSTGGLAFTGANVLKMVLVALALIGLGLLLATAQRRRRRTS